MSKLTDRELATLAMMKGEEAEAEKRLEDRLAGMTEEQLEEYAEAVAHMGQKMDSAAGAEIEEEDA